MDSPNNQPPEDPTKRQQPQPAKPRHPVVQFIHDSLAHMPDDPAETLARFRQMLDLARQHRTELVASGFNADRFIAGMEIEVAKFAAVHAEAEAAQEAVLQSAADLGDARREAFHALDAFVQAASEEAPFHHVVEEAKELLEEWRPHMPKE